MGTPETSEAGLLPARLSVAAVASRLGVAAATLRTWDRRYGLGPSQHAAGAHRRYTAADLDRLQTMRRLTREGVPPAEAARVALGAPLPPAPRSAGSGGRVLALPGADDAVRGLGRAAMALDARSVTTQVREQVQAHGVLATWDHVLRPVLVSVGDRWAATGDGVDVEHLLSDCIAGVLRDVAGQVEVSTTPGPSHPVLLACAPGEWHSLPLHAVAAGLGERGIASRSLGQATPPPALRSALTRLRPTALFLWSQLPGTAGPDALARLPVHRPATRVVVGGPGWTEERLPEGVRLAPDLGAALDLVEQALGA